MEIRTIASLVAVVALIVAAGIYTAHERAVGHKEAIVEVEAASDEKREVNRDTAKTASASFATAQQVIRARPTQSSPEVRNALQRPICQADTPIPSIDLLSAHAASAPVLRLADVPVPVAVIDRLRLAGADPAGQ